MTDTDLPLSRVLTSLNFLIVYLSLWAPIRYGTAAAVTGSTHVRGKKRVKALVKGEALSRCSYLN